MFNNRFNSTHKDPLVEAVRQAQQDGEMRRQAEAIVNEQFGVYSRQAVVREDLAAYDAAIEEAYKCMKEGEKKDEKKEDKPKADYSKMREKMVGKGKDLETTRKIVGEAKKLADKDYDKDGKIESPKDEVWGSRFRAARKAGKMNEAPMDAGSYEGSKSVTKSAPKEDPSTPKSYPGAASSTPTAQRLSNAKAALKEKWEGSKEDKDEDKALAKKHGMTMKQWEKSAADKKHDAKEKMDEAKYSAKAARAGEDIGKPGKMFSKIAKKAGERYGSEERGKKVAGAILKRIRAKHMKEEQIDEIVQKSQMRPGETLGQTMNRLAGKTAIKGGANDPSSPKFKGPSTTSTPAKQSGAPDEKSTQSFLSKQLGRTTSAPQGPEAPAPKANVPTPPSRSASGVDIPRISDAPKVAAAGMPNPRVNAPTPPVRPDTPAPAPMQNPDQARTKVMKEEVQIGDYKYRIV